MLNSKSRSILLAAAITALVLAGCNQKAITIQANEAVSELQFRKFKAGKPEGEPKVVKLSPPSKTYSTNLEFPDGVSYQVVAKRRQFLNGTTTVEYLPKTRTAYDVNLVRYLVDVPLTNFDLRSVKGSRSVRIAPTELMTVGYVDVNERSPAIVGNAELVYRPEVPMNICFIAGVDTNNDVVFQDTMMREKAKTYKVLEDKETIESVAEKFEVDEGELYNRNKDLFKEGERRLRRGLQLDIADPVYVGRIWKSQKALVAPTPLTGDETLNLYPILDQNGKALAYAECRDGKTASLLSIDPNRSTARAQLQGNDMLNLYPSIGLDDLVFARILPDKTSEICILRTKDRYPTRLGVGEMPRISPNGKKIAFLKRTNPRSPNRTLCLMDADGTGVIELTRRPNADIFDLRWNPTSDTIAFSLKEKDQNADVWTIRATGADQALQVTTNKSWDDCPVWDPTGSALYFRSNRGPGPDNGDVGKWGIWKVNLAQ